MTVWTAQSTDEHGAPVRDSGSITYSAALESAASCDTDDTPSQSPKGRTAKRAAAASIGPSVVWFWGMAPPGSGI